MSRPKVDTITAISTPVGKAALSIIRVSGPLTFEILKKIFKTGGKKTFPLPYSVFYGKIIDPETKAKLDEVLVSCFIAPHSFTGEDCAEITTHGNPVIVTRVLSEILKHGARSAEPGEFTRRAFLNGKMDLLEVEATSNILSAENISQARLALNQLDGLPSQRVAYFRKQLLEHLVQLEASLNFPEDAIEAIDEHRLGIELKRILFELEGFSQNAKNGSLVASGLKVVLVGKPNSGKSSLMNYILGRDRAIVTDIAGTTRDTLEENFNFGSFPLKIIDTAGIRNPGDSIEKIGIERTRKAIDEAFVIIAMFDSSSSPTKEDLEILEELKSQDKPFICVLNKSDLPTGFDLGFFGEIVPVKLSVTSGDGYSVLLDNLKVILDEKGMVGFEDMVLLGAQQMRSLENALSALERASVGIGNIYQDMLAIELEEAVRELGRITGETIDVNTLDLIFEKFCIGK